MNSSSGYMRASSECHTQNGDVAPTAVANTAALGPTIRLPTTYRSGIAAVPKMTEGTRSTHSDVPNHWTQKCRIVWYSGTWTFAVTR